MVWYMYIIGSFHLVYMYMVYLATPKPGSITPFEYNNLMNRKYMYIT